MQSWSELFRPHILARGLNYYEMGAVQNLTKTKKGYSAIVEGSEEYEVEIETDGDEILDMYCTCPYAEDGNACKHMAAVLCEIEETNPSEDAQAIEKVSDFQSRENKLKEVIERIPVEELRRMVEEFANQEESVYNHLMVHYAPIEKQQVERLKEEVSIIGDKYSDRSGFVDWYHAGEYTDALVMFLEENISTLLDRGYPKEAFELVNAVFYEIGNRDMDDSDGGTGYVACRCYEYWKEILETCNSEEKENMFQWFLAHEKNYVIDYMEDYITDFLVDEFCDKEILMKKLQQLDAEIERAGEKNLSGSEFLAYYGEVSNIRARINIMEKLGYSRTEILDYRKKYRNFAEIRQLEIEEYLEEKAYDKAIVVLKESKEKDKGNELLVSEYSKQLIRIYKLIKDSENYKKELLFFVFQCRQSNLDYIKRLKAASHVKEWMEYRDKILKSEKSYLVWMDLLVEEEMYEQLLEKIEEQGSAYILEQYEKILKKRFPKRVRDLYIKYVKASMSSVSDRKKYRELIRYLKKIARYPDGKRLTKEIADEWRKEYKRRSALIDELKKAGF